MYRAAFAENTEIKTNQAVRTKHPCPFILCRLLRVMNGFSHHLSREWFSPLFSQPTLNESSRPPLIGRLLSIPRDRLAEGSQGLTPFTENEAALIRRLIHSSSAVRHLLHSLASSLQHPFFCLSPSSPSS